MERVFLRVLVIAFSGIIAFTIANTSAGFMFPIFDDMAASMSFMSGSGVDYSSTSALIKNAFFVAIFIVVAIPFAYLLMRLIKKEEEPEQQNYVYFPG